MNLTNQIQIIYVPWWVRITVSLLVLAALAVCLYLFQQALVGGGSEDWITAGAYVLGVVFPIALIVLVVAGGSFGEASILKRTEHILRKTIPYHLQFIPEEPQDFRDFRTIRRSPKTDLEQLAKIRLHHTKGRCYADYVVTLPDRSEILLRVELNVKRVNINLVFPRARLEHRREVLKFEGDLAQFLDDRFRHTKAVEALQARGQGSPDPETAGTIAYAFNPEILQREINGEDFVALVATTRVADDLVWNPSEKVFFAQDLMFMTRAFLQENPDLFRRDGP